MRVSGSRQLRVVVLINSISHFGLLHRINKIAVLQRSRVMPLYIWMDIECSQFVSFDTYIDSFYMAAQIEYNRPT